MSTIPHNISLFTARFEVSVALVDVVVAVHIDAHYTVYAAAPAHGLPDDVVHVQKVMAVDPAYQPLIDTLTCNNDLYDPLEWAITLRLADGEEGTPAGTVGPVHQIPLRLPLPAEASR